MLDQRLLDDVLALQRCIHRHPEVGYEEVSTTRAVADALARWGVPHRVRDGGVGLVAEVGEGEVVVGYRADLDALPIHETTGLEHASVVPGRMHACGHDAHTAIAFGVAAALVAQPPAGRVRVLFQPAEESFPGGAHDLVDEGLADDLTAIVALHADPSLPAGHVGISPGPLTSSSDRFTITLTGPGGHTARPHETPDTLLAAGKVLSELEAILSRKVDARVPRAVAFGMVRGGDAANVIPAEVVLGGTVRIADDGLWESMGPLFTEAVHAVVAPLGVHVDVDYEVGIAPVVNDPAVTDVARRAAVSVVGEAAVHPTRTSMAAEDFSAFTRLVPGALLRLGCAGRGAFTPLHSARFVFDDGAFAPGVAVGVATLRSLIDRATT